MYDSGESAWELVRAIPAPGLRAYVDGYSGGHERLLGRPWRRREVAGGILPLIINFGAPFLLDGVRFDSFFAGITDRAVVAESTGRSYSIQVDFTPLGASRLIGVPMHELTNQIVAFDALWGAEADRLTARLFEAPTWSARFAILDIYIARRLARARAIPPAVSWAWGRLLATSGRADVAWLASTLGFSRKHLVTLFREHVGLTPKVCGRVLRFDRAMRMLKRPCEPNWTDIALTCGYYDQAHLIRDFRQFAGLTPTELVRESNA